MFTDLGITFKKNVKGDLVKFKAEGLSGMLCSLMFFYLALVREIAFFQVTLSAVIASGLFFVLLMLSNYDRWILKGKPQTGAWIDRVIELFYLSLFFAYGWYGTAFMFASFIFLLFVIRRLAKLKRES